MKNVDLMFETCSLKTDARLDVIKADASVRAIVLRLGNKFSEYATQAFITNFEIAAQNGYYCATCLSNPIAGELIGRQPIKGINGCTEHVICRKDGLEYLDDDGPEIEGRNTTLPDDHMHR